MSRPGANPVTAHSLPGTGTVSDARTLAIQLSNSTWRLLQLDCRTAADCDVLPHMAHASRFHWGQVTAAEPADHARAEWLISRVYAVLGRPEPALHHGRRVLDICAAADIGDWDLAFAYEALARAHALGGNYRQARACTDRALAAAQDITRRGDRDLLLADLENIPGQARYW